MDVSTHASTGGYGNGGNNFWGGHDFHVPSPQRAGTYGLATGPKMTAATSVGTPMSGSMGSFSSPSSMHGMSPMGMMPTGYPSPNPSPAGCYGVATAGGYAAAAAAAANAAPYYSNVGMDYHHHHHSTHSMTSHHHSMGSYGQVNFTHFFKLILRILVLIVFPIVCVRIFRWECLVIPERPNRPMPAPQQPLKRQFRLIIITVA